MSARSRLSSVVLLATAFLSHAHADSSTAWSIDKDRSTSTKHGLYEVQQEAKKFVSRENNRLGANLVVGEPDLRIMVPRCAVPLVAKWAPQAVAQETVAVTCRQTVSKNYGRKRWTVDVAVFKASEIGSQAASSPR